jgi:hypothetical protein
VLWFSWANLVKLLNLNKFGIVANKHKNHKFYLQTLILMQTLINYRTQKSLELGYHIESMEELREVIKSDSINQTIMLENLKTLYRKTYQYEDMQQALSNPISFKEII